MKWNNGIWCCVFAAIANAFPISQAFAADTSICFAPDGDGELISTPSQSLTLSFLSTHEPTLGRTVEWKTLGDDECVTARLVGSYHGQDLYYFAYKHKQGAEGILLGSFDYAILALADRAAGQTKTLRTFFIVDGDGTDDFNVTARPGPTNPATVNVERHFSGSGHFWDSFTFDLTSKGPRLIEGSKGGRMNPGATTYRYDEHGKIIAKESN